MHELSINISFTGKKKAINKIQNSIFDYFLARINSDLEISTNSLILSDENYWITFKKTENDGSLTEYKIEKPHLVSHKEKKNKILVNFSFKTYAFSFEFFREFFEFISSQCPEITIIGNLISNDNALLSITAETHNNILIIREPEFDPETGNYTLLELHFDPFQNKYIGGKKIE